MPFGIETWNWGGISLKWQYFARGQNRKMEHVLIDKYHVIVFEFLSNYFFGQKFEHHKYKYLHDAKKSLHYFSTNIYFYY